MAEDVGNKSDDSKRPFGFAGFIIWPMVLVVLYVLSTGPVVKFWENSKHESKLAEGYCWPAVWLYERTPLGKPLGLYWHLWAPNHFDRNGEFSLHGLPW